MIRNFVTDCDGVLTDGKVYYTVDGKEGVSYHSNDSYAMKKMKDIGIRVIMITSASLPKIHENRAMDLGIEFYHVTLGSKKAFVVNELKLNLDETAYAGDCYDDVELLTESTLGFIPANASSDMWAYGYVLERGGGGGCILEVYNRIMEYNDGRCS